MYNLPPLLHWTHVVLNYIEPEDKSGTPKQPGDGRLVIGRQHSDADEDGVDELLLFNQKLTNEEVLSLKNMI